MTQEIQRLSRKQEKALKNALKMQFGSLQSAYWQLYSLDYHGRRTRKKPLLMGFEKANIRRHYLSECKRLGIKSGYETWLDNLKDYLNDKWAVIIGCLFLAVLAVRLVVITTNLVVNP